MDVIKKGVDYRLNSKVFKQHYRRRYIIKKKRKYNYDRKSRRLYYTKEKQYLY